MSVGILEVPNDKTLYSKILNAGNINFPQVAGDGILLPTVGGTPLLLDYYESNTYATTLTLAWTTPVAVTLKIIRIGNNVTINISEAEAVSDLVSNSIAFAASLPARFRPSVAAGTIGIPAVLRSGGIDVTGQILINSSGGMSLQTLPIGNFTTSCGIHTDISVTYNIL